MIYKHIDSVEVSSIFSKCGKYRYRLDISLNTPQKKEEKTVCAIMQNPSVANNEIADKSVQFLEKLVFTKGIKEFENIHKLIIVNQFAYIQTKTFEGFIDKMIGKDNEKHISNAISEADIVLVAWGSSNSYDERKKVIYNIMNTNKKGKTYLNGKSHPSRASYENYISPLDISTLSI